MGGKGERQESRAVEAARPSQPVRSQPVGLRAGRMRRFCGSARGPAAEKTKGYLGERGVLTRCFGNFARRSMRGRRTPWLLSVGLSLFLCGGWALQHTARGWAVTSHGRYRPASALRQGQGLGVRFVAGHVQHVHQAQQVKDVVDHRRNGVEDQATAGVAKTLVTHHQPTNAR